MHLANGSAFLGVFVVTVVNRGLLVGLVAKMAFFEMGGFFVGGLPVGLGEGFLLVAETFL